MADARQELSHEGFTSDEVEEILRRASELQSQVERREDMVDQNILEASAEEAGIRREFIEQAIQQLREERQRQTARRASQRRIATIAGVLAAVFVVSLAWFSHSVLNRRLADVEEKQAQLENVLQRRYDLIPNLIALAKASALHEKEVVASLGRLHEALSQTDSLEQKQTLEAKLGEAVGELMSLLRADPQASSTVVFVRLSDEMSGAENRIAVERKRYNEAVAAYNRTARSFPIALVRPLLGLPKAQAYFQTSAEARRAPRF
jgi:LemA protein